MPHLPVTFFYPYPAELEQIESLRLEGDIAFWNVPKPCRRRAWVLRTYLNLRKAGYDVSVSEQLPEEGVVVLLPEDEIRRAFLAQYIHEHNELFILTIRADIFGFRWPLADGDIVQNGRFADDKRTFFVPHWPQPGLIPRDVSRGDTVRRIAFKGGFGSLRADFRSDRWFDFLASKGLTFDLDAPHNGSFHSWHDYSDVDVLLAVRPEFNDGGLRCDKPASKLVNAWHAGIPALLGPEYAFRELRQSDLDYIEVDSVEEATRGVIRLMDDPSLYKAMVENGKRRASTFTATKITERWAEVLFDRLPELTEQREFQLKRHAPRYIRSGINLALSRPSFFEFRKQVGYVLRHFRSKLGKT